MPWNSRRSLQEPRRASPTPHLFLFLLLFLGFRRTHEPLREDPFEDDLHVHRIVLKEGRGGDDRQIVVVVQEAFRERLEAQGTLLDRSEERRVGKECRSRGSPDRLKKNRI